MTKITIFSGFLGAGKTTLIKKLIADGYAREKLVLIENEFGEIGIDGGFLKEAGIQITEMNSGCICCSLVGDFGRALQKVLDEYAPDRILIEPSGVGKLSDVIAAVQALHADVELAGFVTLASSITTKLSTPVPSSSAAPRISAKKSWLPLWPCCAKRTPRRPLSPPRGTSSLAHSCWTRWSAAAP